MHSSERPEEADAVLVQLVEEGIEVAGGVRTWRVAPGDLVGSATQEPESAAGVPQLGHPGAATTGTDLGGPGALNRLMVTVPPA